MLTLRNCLRWTSAVALLTSPVLFTVGFSSEAAPPSTRRASLETPASAPVAWDAEGKLIRPENYREWVYVGTPLTPNDLNNGKAAFPEFHNVYIDPESWNIYKREGVFRDGTVLVKELIDVAAKQATSGKGYFMGDFIGLEVALKNKAHYPDEPGNWAYFSFGHEYPLALTATAFPSASCNSCHENTAADDFVFTQYYPQLRAAKSSGLPNREWRGPQFDGNHQLTRPEGYREWVYVGTPVTPNDMNNGEAPFPEFHSVYIDPASWRIYKETGVFPEGTTLVKELLSVGSTAAVSGNGYFMGDFLGLEVTIKSKQHFPDEPGNWSYFSFGHAYPLADKAKAFETMSCNSCHAGNAADDYVFTQYYPVLAAAKPGAEEHGKANDVHDGKNCEKCEESLQEVERTAARSKKPNRATPGQSGETIPTDAHELFAFLKAGKYKAFPGAESGTHPSTGPHSIRGSFGHPVRSYLNQVMLDSLEAGNKVHPQGAGIVKEMFSQDGKLEGFAVSLKTHEDSDGGNGWFWYEVLSTTDESDLAANGNGVAGCFGCHGAGNDFVLTKFPLK